MQQLSELDASFLYMEQESSPMHVGAVYVLSCEHRGECFSFKEFCSHIEMRLPLAPRLRQRLVEVPFHLDYPYWADDPEFSLDKHTFHLPLQGSRDQKDLLDVAAEFLKTPLKRSQPLWEIALVDGIDDPTVLPGTSCAILVKIHHAAIDGVTGEGLMSVLLDFSADTEPTLEALPWQPKPIPSKVRLLGSAYSSAFSTPRRLAHKAKDKAASTYYSLLVKRLQKLSLPPALFTAPYTALNQHISNERAFAYHEFPIERLKRVKAKAPGVTLNDIVMTLCSEISMHFLQSTAIGLPTSSLIALSPISVRSKRIDSPTGSELAAVLLSMATTEANLAVRLKRIHDNASASKIYGQAISASRLTELMPSAMLGLATRVYTKFQLAQRHKPLFNIPIANIPGPSIHLYFNGARVDYQFSTAPLFDGIGLVIMVMSYADKVTFTFTACPKIVPNLEAVKEGANNALSQLEADIDTIDFNALSSENDQDSTASKPLSALIRDTSGLFTGVFASAFSKLKKKGIDTINASKKLGTTNSSGSVNSSSVVQ